MVTFKLHDMKANLIIFFILSLSGCQIDNYQAPEITLSGNILDAETNDLVESGGINAGTIVKLYEDNSIQPLLFETVPEGKFANSKVFAGNYKLEAEGPFTLAQEGLIDLKVTRNEDIDIKVIPNVRLTIGVQEQDAASATITLSYEKVAENQSLVDYGLVWSEYKNPNVYSFSGGSIIQQNAAATDLTSGEKSFVVPNLKPNTTYYVRGTARTQNPGNYYNYSSQVMLKTQ